MFLIEILHKMRTQFKIQTIFQLLNWDHSYKKCSYPDLLNNLTTTVESCYVSVGRRKRPLAAR